MDKWVPFGIHGFRVDLVVEYSYMDSSLCGDYNFYYPEIRMEERRHCRGLYSVDGYFL